MSDTSCLFIMPRFGTIHRGAEASVREVCSRLPKLGIRVAILASRHNLSLPGVEMLFAPLVCRERTGWLDRNRFARRFLSLFGLRAGAEMESACLYLTGRKVSRKQRYDAVIPVGGMWTYRLAKKSLPQAVIISWGQAGPVQAELDSSDAFIAITDADAQKSATMATQPIFIMPNGVDTSAFGLQPSPPETPTILCCAALTEFKRLDLLLDAVGLLDTSVRLIFAGKGPLEATLRAHPTCATHHVSFISRPWNEMSDVYQHATIFSLPSPNETFGIVFLEALSTGLNVVCHDAPPSREVMGERGFYVDVHDPGAYAAALLRALDSPNPHENRARAGMFSWDRAAEKFASVVVSLMQDKAKNG